MKIHDILESHILEGPNDPAIFKAIWTAGGPGSGKTYVVRNTALESMGFKLVNSDTQFERYLRQMNMASDPETIFSPQGQEVRNRAKRVTKAAQAGYTQGRLGLVIDGTGKDYDNIANQYHSLRMLGYDGAMIFVNTNLETALERNAQRDRSLPDEVVKQMWNRVQDNIGKFQRLFKNNMIIVDNSNGANVEDDLKSAYSQLNRWADEKPTTPQAIAWLRSQNK